LRNFGSTTLLSRRTSKHGGRRNYRTKGQGKLCIEEGYIEERKKEENQMIQTWEARCKQEEILWWKKYRIRWLKEGERNTKLFHRTTIERRSHNKILKIRDQDGIERESHQDIENTLVKHFQGIAKEPNRDRTVTI